MRSTSTMPTPASIRLPWRSSSPSATCARFRRIRSPRRAPPGSPCRRRIRKKAACSTSTAPPRAMSAGRVKKQTGFTYIGLLIFIAIAGLGLAAYAEIASTATQREKEAELLFRGNQFQAAIASYYKKESRYPQSLEQLLEDKRFPMPVRHLRRLYRDPMTGEADWGLLEAPGGGVMGVVSKCGRRARERGECGP